MDRTVLARLVLEAGILLVVVLQEFQLVLLERLHLVVVQELPLVPVVPPECY